jgi:hypothetical protein
MPVFKDITNQVFGRLRAVSLHGRDLHGIAIWECVCDCGSVCRIRLSSLVAKSTKSCGCLNNESRKRVHSGNTHAKTHGLSYHPLYSAWATMKQRCFNPKNAKFKHYGARGIGVCQEWCDSFETFLKDMGDRPEGTTLDRIDNSLGYSKSNCRWSTHSEQNSNRREYHKSTRDRAFQ